MLFPPTAAAALIDLTEVAFAELLGTLPGATVQREHGLHWVDTGRPEGALNGVQMAPDDGDDHVFVGAIAQAVTHFRGRRLPFHWRTGLRPEPAEAGRLLTLNGFTMVDREPGMWADLDTPLPAPPPVQDLTIQPVRDDAALRDWTEVWGHDAPAEVTARWFDVYRQLPRRDLTFLLGTIGGVPVATCYLFRISGVAAIHYVVTLPAYRRRGIGAAMTIAAMRAAQESGCHVAVLMASALGEPVYRRLGFQECCRVDTYAWHPRA
ncbi:MAG TPA: GNAT family N-acetyltransferase [Micromonosporaceae bacterium]